MSEMPRKSTSQPRMGSESSGEKKLRTGPRTQPITVPPMKGRKTTLSAVVKGLSARASVADLARLSTEAAMHEAQEEGRRAGLTGSQLRGAMARARAGAIKSLAQKTSSSPTTVRRWVAGTQAPSAKVSAASREKLVRSLGGAQQVRAAQIRATRTIEFKSGRFMIEPYPEGSQDYRTIDKPLEVDTGRMADVATLLEDGKQDEAMEKLGDAILEAYGSGLSGVLTLTEIPGDIIWG